jgi:phosphomethylpyrimidine synthase
MKITQDVRDYAASLGNNEKAALGLDSPPPGGVGSGVGSSFSAEAARGMQEMSDKFNAMGQQVYIDADKVQEGKKAPHTTALDSEAAHAAKNAALVKESNKAL